MKEGKIKCEDKRRECIKADLGRQDKSLRWKDRQKVITRKEGRVETNLEDGIGT